MFEFNFLNLFFSQKVFRNSLIRIFYHVQKRLLYLMTQKESITYYVFDKKINDVIILSNTLTTLT